MIGVLLASALTALVCVPLAHAQLGLPDAIPTSTQLSADDQATLKAYVDANKSGLGAEVAAIRRSRNALIAPLRVRNVSADFRTRYTDALVPVLKPLVVSDREEVAINALRLAGELGTKGGVDLLDKGLESKKVAVRFMAAQSYGGVFTAAREGLPGVSAAQANAIMTTLSRAASREGDGMVLSGIAAALDAASEVPGDRLEGARARACEAIASGIGEAIRKPTSDRETTRVALEAGKSLFDLLQNVNVPPGELPQSTIVEIAGFAGDVLALVRRRLAAGPTDAERPELGLIAAQASRIYFFAHQRVGGPGGQAIDLGRLDDLIVKSQDDRYLAQIAKVIGADGVLTKPPFSLKPDRFK